jgi:hypothetical protein
LKEYAKYDGMRATPCNSVDILVAVVAAFDDISNQFLDFHWYRQMYDGRWTHKPGHTKVRDTDASGRKITNPKTCNRNNIPIGGYNYQYFCGYLCVPKGKIDLDKYENALCYYSDYFVLHYLNFIKRTFRRINTISQARYSGPIYALM